MSGVGGALDCSVMEEDWQRGQSYSAHWHSLGVSRLQRPTVTEAERSDKYWEARRRLRRFLSGAIGQRLPPESGGEPATKVEQDGAFDFCPKSLVLETKTTMKMTLPRFLG